MLDGVVLARKTGAGALKRPVLVALGIRPVSIAAAFAAKAST